MGYPVGPLLTALARRVLTNLEFIEAAAPQWGSPEQDAAPFADTQLLISLLGVLIFPHERNANALGELLQRYDHLGSVLKVMWPRDNHGTIEVTDATGGRVEIDPTLVDQLPRLLRNSIAHFNVRPIDIEGRFGGIRVWNRDDHGRITFVGDVHFDDLLPLAKFILHELAQGGTTVQLDDPPDPLPEAEGQIEVVDRNAKAPRLIDNIWRVFLEAENNDAGKAKTRVDRLLKKEADLLKPRTR